MITFPVLIDIYARRGSRLALLDRLSLPMPGFYAIGRQAESEIRLDAESVSREHAFLAVRAAGLEVVDRASTNGTFIGDARIDQAPWDRTQPLRIEPFELRLVEEGTAIVPPRPQPERPQPQRPPAAPLPPRRHEGAIEVELRPRTEIRASEAQEQDAVRLADSQDRQGDMIAIRLIAEFGRFLK